jgi:hypothetical protein
MHLPDKYADFTDLSGLVTSALSKAADALARTKAAARDWLLVTDEDPDQLASATLTESVFTESRTDLLGDWDVLTAGAPVQELHNILLAAGFDPGRQSAGTRAAGTKCLGRYLGIAVNDPLLGNFVVRLWLLADWENGLELLLGAYRPVKPAHALKYPADVKPGALALVSLAKAPVDWAGLTLAEAKAHVWAWQKDMLATGAAGSVGVHWPTLQHALDEAMAP